MNQSIQLQQSFDPQKIPANRELALLHQRATMCGQLIESDDFCPCCGLGVLTKQIPLTTDIINLSFLGQGIPLFYSHTCLIVLLNFILFLILGLPTITINYLANDCIEPNNYAYQVFMTKGCSDNCPMDHEDFTIITLLISSTDCDIICSHYTDLCQHTSMSQFSFPNKQASSNYKLIQSILVLGSVILIKIYLIFIRQRQKVIENNCDKSLISPSDFTAMLDHLPEQDYDEKELKAAIESYCKSFDHQNDYEVVKINIAYDIKTFITKSRQVIKLEKNQETKIKKLDSDKQTNKSAQSQKKLIHEIEKIKLNIKELNKEMIEIEKEIEKGSYRKTTSIAFITFQQKKCKYPLYQELQNLLEQTKLSYWESFLIKLKQLVQNRDKRGFYFKGKLISICRAPEPDDVFWENCGVEYKLKVKRQIMSWIVITMLLGMSFGILFSLNSLQNQYLSKKLDLVTKTVLSLIKSLIITIIDVLINYFITLLANSERHITKTHQDTSLSQKLTLVQFTNSCLILIIINLIFEISDDNFQNGSKYIVQKQGGIANDMLFVCGMNALVNQISTLFNPIYLIKKIKQHYIETQGKLTQIQANKLFEGPETVLYEQYSYLCKATWITLFFAPLIPICILFNLVGLFAFYWVEKYVLLRRNSKPPFQSSHLDREMLTLMDLSPILLSGMQYWMDDIFNSGYLCSSISLTSLILASLELIVPSYRIHRMLFKDQDEDDSNQRYVDVYLQLPTDYDRTNPLTSQQATQEFLKKKFEILSRSTISNNRQTKRKSTAQALREYIMKGAPDSQQVRMTILKKKVQSVLKLRKFKNMNFAERKKIPDYIEPQESNSPQHESQMSNSPQYSKAPTYNFSKVVNRTPIYSQYLADLTDRSSLSSSKHLNTSRYNLTTKRSIQLKCNQIE